MDVHGGYDSCYAWVIWAIRWSKCMFRENAEKRITRWFCSSTQLIGTYAIHISIILPSAKINKARTSSRRRNHFAASLASFYIIIHLFAGSSSPYKYKLHYFIHVYVMPWETRLYDKATREALDRPTHPENLASWFIIWYVTICILIILWSAEIDRYGHSLQDNRCYVRIFRIIGLINRYKWKKINVIWMRLTAVLLMCCHILYPVVERITY